MSSQSILKTEEIKAAKKAVEDTKTEEKPVEAPVKE